jgi:putative Holliday junction resolvase
VRAIGIDYGARRIGIALSDPTGTLASPLTVVERRKGKRPPLRRLEDIARESGAAQLVVGLPLDLDGREDDWCAETRWMGERLAERLGIPVDFVDERFTSTWAERAIRSAGLPRSKREEKGRVDAAAAALILQAWLDRSHGS